MDDREVIEPNSVKERVWGPFCWKHVVLTGKWDEVHYLTHNILTWKPVGSYVHICIGSISTYIVLLALDLTSEP